METGKKVAIGLGVVAAISIIYFGFTEKGKNKWKSLTAPKGTDASGNSKPRIGTAEDGGRARDNADGDTYNAAAKKRDKYNQRIHELKQQGMVS